MKLTMIEGKSSAVPAALLSDGTLMDLAAASSAGLLSGRSVRSVTEILDLENGMLATVRGLVERAEAGTGSLRDQLLSLDALHEERSAIYAPLLRPRMILSCGMAYREHMAEMGVAPPTAPTAFLKSVNAINPHRRPLVLPARDPDMADFECEFSCVIGRAFHDISPAEALAYVAGFTMVNDVGSRTQVPAWLKSMSGGSPLECVKLYALTMLDKQYPSFCPLGPVVVTSDEFGDPNDVTVETRLNGELMQSAHSSDLIFPLAYSLSYFSRWYRFEPGDVLTTGSPSGVGFARNPQRFLRPDDVIEVSGSRVGKLLNPVVAESKRQPLSSPLMESQLAERDSGKG
jgi:acylpyruvate hydrolase